MKLRKKYQIILWSINSGDSMMESFDVDRSMNTLKKQTKPGDIVLFHFCHKHEKETRKLLPVYLQWLKDNGYKSQSIV